MCVLAMSGRDMLVRVKWLVCAWVYASWMCLYVTLYVCVCYLACSVL